jgi:hypothetical protein
MSLTAFIGFSTPKAFNPVSWLIRKVTKSQVSHAWVVYHSDLFDLEMVMEAHELGFRSLTLEHFKAKNKIVLLHPIDVDVTPGLRLLAVHLGDTYDYAGLFGMGIVLIQQRLRGFFKKWKKRFKNPWQSANKYFCSEAVVTMLQASNSRMVEDVMAENTSPQMLMDILTGKK